MQPLSKAKIKHYASLKQKKFRYQHHLFMVEGEKMVAEALQSGWQIEAVILREDRAQAPLPTPIPPEKTFQTDAAGFKRLSSQVHPEGILAILPFPEATAFSQITHLSDLSTPLPQKAFLLQDIQDPGNLGTILRIADWFGMEAVFCSASTVDIWNPKALRGCMGAIFRVQVVYLEHFTTAVKTWATQICAADMQGPVPAESRLKESRFILLGNEANGISDEIRTTPGLNFVTIPGQGGAESLNVSVAAGILAYAGRMG